jgi:hypothetical protein
MWTLQMEKAEKEHKTVGTAMDVHTDQGPEFGCQ